MAIPDPAITATSRTGSWVISELRRLGALSPETAQPVHVNDFGMQYTLQQLLDMGILQEERRGLYYLDERVLAPVETRARRLRVAIVILGIVVLISLLVRIFRHWL